MTDEKRMPWPTEKPRAREEWDFRGHSLPDTEVSWCHEYELARICLTDAWRGGIADFRKRALGNDYDAYFERAKWYFDNHAREDWPAVFYALWPEWPNKPYLSVPADERSRRIRNWLSKEDPDELPVEAIEGDFNAISQVLRELELKHSDSLAQQMRAFVTGKGEITLPILKKLGDTLPGFGGYHVAHWIPDHMRSKTKFLALMSRWFDRWQKRHGIEPEERRGAGSGVKVMRADLCAIGFWRLVKSGLSRRQAYIFVASVSSAPPVSDHKKRWSEAIRRANRLLSGRFPKDFKG